MVTWIVKLNKNIYAEFEFDKYLKLIHMSDQARIDNLPGKLDQEWVTFDPRHQSMPIIKTPKDIYEADMYLTAIFYESKYDVASEGLNWSKVLQLDLPGIVH
jgi:hypothetical protein